MPDTHAPLSWDETGNRLFETGTKKGVLFVMNSDGTYGNGIAWNGLTAVTESNSGAEETALWADDMKYAVMRSAEEFGITIEAYQCPPEFYACDGSAAAATGVTLSGQGRKGFGFSYVTTVGNDVNGRDHGYKIHLVYGCTASPSERSYQTINDSPDAITLSWEVSTQPVSVGTVGNVDYKPTSHIVIDSTTCDAQKLAAFEAVLYGSTDADSRLPLPYTGITTSDATKGVIDFFI